MNLALFHHNLHDTNPKYATSDWFLDFLSFVIGSIDSQLELQFVRITASAVGSGIYLLVSQLAMTTGLRPVIFSWLQHPAFRKCLFA